jgi:peptide/nickel transport system substrate-binding protein
MKRPLKAIIPALASPFNFVYSKKDLDTHGYAWHKTHINGTGAFKFVQEQPGAFVEAKRNDDYFIKGKPYLDGYKAIQAPKMSSAAGHPRQPRLGLSRFAEGRRKADHHDGQEGFRQRGDVNNLMGVVPNQKKKETRDPRVRR